MKIWILIQTMIATLVFFPTKEYNVMPEDYGLNAEMITLTTQDQVAITGWYLEVASQKGAIYFLHGNAGNISDRLFKAAEWVKRGFSVFLLDYRSYGKSAGKITSENDIYEDTETGLRWLHEVKKLSDSEIVIYGESIGAAPAIHLAMKASVWALILEAPFTSLVAVAKTHYPFVPNFVMNGFQFQNLEKISKIKAPMLIVHGEDDEVSPFAMGETLYKEAREPKEFFRIAGGHHNDLSELVGSEFYDRPSRFLMNLKDGGIKS
ncbi:MAG: alpha/beta hydrolase [Candidatus Omnitrophica bacterium]|nr:alpha/beta hydrolase [Candidatus Omnitrophota bacterium]